MSYRDKKTKRWRFRYRDDDNEKCHHTGFVSKQQADAAHVRLKERRRLIEAGQIVPVTEKARERAARPIAEVVADYAAHLRNLKKTAKYIETTELRLLKVFPLGGIKRLSDLNAASTAKTLAAYGNLPEVGERTVKDALTAIRQLLKHCGVSPDPTAGVKLPKVTEHEHARRAATPQEVHLLRDAARRPAMSRNGRGWWPVDREALIVLVVATGMRRGDMIGMRVGDLILNGPDTRVIGKAVSSKNREAFVQPLAVDTAAWLRAWVGTRPPESLLFPSLTAHTRVSQIIARCCAAAGVPYRDKDGRYLDGHALRHTFITNVVRGGTDIRTAMELARHRNVATTMRYAHTNDELKRAAVERLNGGAA